MSHPCSECDRSFASAVAWGVHRRRSHGIQSPSRTDPDAKREMAKASRKRRLKVHNAVIRQWRLKHPDKQRAHEVVARAIKRGKLSRGAACETCRETNNLHAHHDDYSKPLEIRWLCAKCHRKHHRDTEKL